MGHKKTLIKKSYSRTHVRSVVPDNTSIVRYHRSGDVIQVWQASIKTKWRNGSRCVCGDDKATVEVLYAVKPVHCSLSSHRLPVATQGSIYWRVGGLQASSLPSITRSLIETCQDITCLVEGPDTVLQSLLVFSGCPLPIVHVISSLPLRTTHLP